MRTIAKLTVAFLLVPALLFAEDMVTAVRGTITKLDASTKTIVIKTKDGADHTFHYLDKTTVHGASKAEMGGKDSWKGLKEGSEVVAHCTEKGSDHVAMEIDKVGKDGMKSAEGTVSKVDREGKMLVVKTDKGAEETYHLSDSAAKDAGKDVSDDAKKGAKVTVYYTEDAGKKIVHFFE
jgi:arginine repressor